MFLSYCRVSTADQAADGTTSMAEQSRRNNAIAVMRNVDKFDVQEYEDPGVSGSVPLGLRPAGERMLADAKPGDVICSSKLDRLFRSATDALQTVKLLRERGVDVILADLGTEPVGSSSTAQLFFGMLSVFAEFERARIGERMTDGRAVKREHNGHLGGEPPYGWKTVGAGRAATLTEEPAEQEVVKLVLHLHERGTGAFHISQALNTRGLVNRRGGRFYATQVLKIIGRASKQQVAA